MIKKIKIGIVEDQQMFRDGIISLLREHDGMELSFQAANGKECMNILETGMQVDIILMDLEMPVMGGIKTTEVVRKHYPTIKILILTMYDDFEFINEVYKKGANGFLLKDSPYHQLIEAINCIIAGGSYFAIKPDEGLKEDDKIISDLRRTDLSESEIEIITLVCREFSIKEIAETLCISERTVARHRENIMEKIGVKKIAGIVAFGVKNKLDFLPIKNRKLN